VVQGLGTLARGLRPVLNTRRAYLYLTELDENDAIATVRGRPVVRRFQYYPESINDAKQVNWSPKEVMGASLPLYEWISSGERTISLTAVFTTDTDHLMESAELGNFGSAVVGRVIKHSERLKAAGVSGQNVWIPGAIAWLRRFMLPRYGETAEVGVPRTSPPRKLLFTAPGTFISTAGGDGGFSSTGGLYVIMTSCDVTYTALFPSGNPRIAEVSLSFAEVPQVGGRVKFPRVTDALDALVDETYVLGADHDTGSAGSS